MTTVLLRLAEAVEQRLKTPTPVATLIERSRVRELAAGAGTSVIVRSLPATPAEGSYSFSAPSIWQARVAVELYASAVGQADAALDTLLQAVMERLMAEPRLGGAAPSGLAPESVSIEHDQEDRAYASALIVLSARINANPNLT